MQDFLQRDAYKITGVVSSFHRIIFKGPLRNPPGQPTIVTSMLRLPRPIRDLLTNCCAAARDLHAVPVAVTGASTPLRKKTSSSSPQ
jgi:hypothetical protein